MWFSYCPVTGFEQHNTETEAKAAAEESLDHFRGQAHDGWAEEVVNICYGKVIGSVVETEREEVPEGVTVDDMGQGSDGNDYSRVHGIVQDVWADYGLRLCDPEAIAGEGVR